MVSPEEFYEAKVADSYPLFIEETYRKICREQLKNSYSQVGEWLGKTGNLDIVAVDENGKVSVAACSYSRAMSVEDYEWLIFSAKKAKINVADIFLFGEKGFDSALIELATEKNIKLMHLWA